MVAITNFNKESIVTQLLGDARGKSQKMLELIGQTVGTIVLILGSAMTGAAFILGGQVLLKRRRLIAALHNEILLNRIEIKSLQRKVSNRSSGIDVFRFADISTEVYKGVQKEAPTFYIDVYNSSDELGRLYNLLGSFEKFSQEIFWLLDTPSIRLDGREGKYVLGNDDSEEDDTPELLHIVENHAVNAAREIEDFTESTFFRRIIYYGCIKEPVEPVLY